MKMYVKEIIQEVMAVGQHRADIVEGDPSMAGWGMPAKTDIADIDIYLSSAVDDPFFDQISGASPSGGRNEMMSEERQEAVIASLRDELQARLRSRTKTLDTVRWHLTERAPICEACGAENVDMGKVGSVRT